MLISPLTTAIYNCIHICILHMLSIYPFLYPTGLYNIGCAWYMFSICLAYAPRIHYMFIACRRSRWLTMCVLYGQKCGTTNLFLIILLVTTLSFYQPLLVTTFNAYETIYGLT